MALDRAGGAADEDSDARIIALAVSHGDKNYCAAANEAALALIAR